MRKAKNITLAKNGVYTTYTFPLLITCSFINLLVQFDVLDTKEKKYKGRYKIEISYTLK